GRGRIGAGFGEFVSAHVRQGGEALRMLPGGILRVATRISIEIEEERYLDSHASAGAIGVIGTVARIAATAVDIDGVVPVADRVGDPFADLSDNRRSGTPICGRRRIDEMAIVGYHRPNLSVSAGVLVGSLRIIRIAEAGIPGVESTDLVSDKRGVGP